MKKTAEQKHDEKVLDRAVNIISTTTPEDLSLMHATLTYHILTSICASEKEANKRFSEIGKIMFR